MPPSPRALFALAALSLSLTACGAAMNSSSGDDQARSGAVGIEVGVPVDDRVSADEGDHTDWKSFRIESESPVTIRFWWDDEDLEARVTVRNAFGTVVYAQSREGDARKMDVGPVDLPAGQYFLQVQAEGGSSVYTMLVEVAGGAAKGRPDF